MEFLIGLARDGLLGRPFLSTAATEIHIFASPYCSRRSPLYLVDGSRLQVRIESFSLFGSPNVSVFRPDYLELGRLAEKLRHIPILALSATCPPRVQDDIIRILGLPQITPGTSTLPSFCRQCSSSIFGSGRTWKDGFLFIAVV